VAYGFAEKRKGGFYGAFALRMGFVMKQVWGVSPILQNRPLYAGQKSHTSTS